MALTFLYVAGIFCVLLTEVVGQEFDCRTLQLSTGTAQPGAFVFVGSFPAAYSPGSPIQVFVVPTNGGANIRSIVVQVRRAPASTVSPPVGSFDLPANFQYLTCGTSTTGTVFSNNLDSGQITLTWNAPVNSIGNLEIRVTYEDVNGNIWSQETLPVITGPGGPCDTNPCLNGGGCVIDTNTGFRCDCPQGNNDPLCDIGSACEPNPCINGVQCFPIPTGFFCNCPSDTIQPICEPDVVLSISPCPSLGQVNQIPVGADIFIQYTPPACSDLSTVTCVPPPSTLVPSLTSITCSCESLGQTASCTTVGNVPPVIAPCPAAAAVQQTDVGGGQRFLQYTPPTCADNEDGALAVNCVPSTGSVTSLGVITCSCTDSGSLTAECTVVLIGGGPCNSNPCLSGGTCSVVNNGFFCTCPPLTNQPRCQGGPICNPNPCQGGAECRPTQSVQTGYTCHLEIGQRCI